MYRLTKVASLKNFHFYNDFKWFEDDCREFTKANIIYGWNGSGKTTFCNFLLQLSIRKIQKSNIKYSLQFKDSNVTDTSSIKVTDKNIDQHPIHLRVFHENYIRDTLPNLSDISHIFIIGKQEKMIEEQIEAGKSYYASLKNDVNNRLEPILKELISKFESYKTSKAAEIKADAGYSNYNKGHFIKNFEKYYKDNVKKSISENEYILAKKSIHVEMKEVIDPIHVSLLTNAVGDYIREILNDTPSNLMIERLLESSNISTWVQDGLVLHNQLHTDICQFCGNKISKECLEAISSHFNQSYKVLSGKIEKAITTLNMRKMEFESLYLDLPDEGLLYPELRDIYANSKLHATELCKFYIAKIDAMVILLQKKQVDIINNIYVNEFDEIISQLGFDYSIINSLNETFTKHNEKSRDFSKSIQNSQKIIELYHLINCESEYKEFDKKISDMYNEQNEKNLKCKEVEMQISNLSQRIKNSQIPADLMNKDIGVLMGRNELKFENTDKGYRLSRNGSQVTQLSKGEQNAIALIYFFNSLSDMNVVIKDSIVVLDDPISSFDSNFYYNAMSYIRTKSEEAGQVFIFTHKFSFFRDYLKMYRSKEPINKYLLKRKDDVPHLQNIDKSLLENYDEYTYLFKQIYFFVKKPTVDQPDYLQYPNMARRLLEGFLAFKIPDTNKDMFEKAKDLDDGQNPAFYRSILRILNNKSHYGNLPDVEILDDVSNIGNLQSLLSDLLKFINIHDRKHFDVLAQVCDPTYDDSNVYDMDYDIDLMVEEVVVNPFPLKEVALYDIAAAAGLGNFIDYPSLDQIRVKNQSCDFAIRIDGDSMTPQIPDESIALVKQTEDVPFGKPGIYVYDDKAYCKKKIIKDGKIYLVSNNTNYPPIEIFEGNAIATIGAVIEVISEDDVFSLF